MTTSVQTTYVIQSAEQLKALAAPIRLEIIKKLVAPQTVKTLAKQLEWEQTKLYYHIRQLEKHELIYVVDTRIVSGIIEKTYQARAFNYQISSNLLAESEQPDEEIDALLESLFDLTRKEIKRSVQANIFSVEPESEKEDGLLWRSTLRLTPTQFEKFVQQMESLLEEIDATSEENAATAVSSQTQGITVAFYPISRKTAPENW